MVCRVSNSKFRLFLGLLIDAGVVLLLRLLNRRMVALMNIFKVST